MNFADVNSVSAEHGPMVAYHRLRRNGDPIIAFRVLPNGDVSVVCVTTKHEMFGRTQKSKFVQNHRSGFPNPKPRKR